eukprot:m.8290 g.8290  ORF g.8290 m.8290 type:complete len:260 (+) comp20475_c0_seq1:97-876(+)
MEQVEVKCRCPEHQFDKVPEIIFKNSHQTHPRFAKSFPGYLTVKCGDQLALLVVKEFSFRANCKCIRLPHADSSYTIIEFVRTYNPNLTLSNQSWSWCNHVFWNGKSIGRFRRRGQLPLHSVECPCDWCRFSLGFDYPFSPTQPAVVVDNAKDGSRSTYSQFVSVEELLDAYRAIDDLEKIAGDKHEEEDHLLSCEDDEDIEDFSNYDGEAELSGSPYLDALQRLEFLEMQAEREKKVILERLLEIKKNERKGPNVWEI